MQLWLAAILATAVTAAAPAAAAPAPTGEWRVRDGSAHIRIVGCGNVLWGVVSWEKKPGPDSHNPDPAQRGRPTLGIPVLRDMHPGDNPGHWEGEVYNAKNGKTYDATMDLRQPDTLHVEGCALGILCGGQDWTRLMPAQAAQPHKRWTSGTVAAASSPATAPANAICAGLGAGVGAGAGRPHENRLEQHGSGQRAQ